MFLLPTRSPRDYRGKYPNRINSVGYSNSAAQQALGVFLGIKRPVHFETNDGRRFIADISEVKMNEKLFGVELDSILVHVPTLLVELDNARYQSMLAIVRGYRQLTA